MFTLFADTSVLRSAGVEAITCGGVSSYQPPSGRPMRAHDESSPITPIIYNMFLSFSIWLNFLFLLHHHYLLNGLAVVREAWYLVLSAELALRAQPVVELSFACYDNL